MKDLEAAVSEATAHAVKVEVKDLEAAVSEATAHAVKAEATDLEAAAVSEVIALEAMRRRKNISKEMTPEVINSKSRDELELT